MKDKRENSDKAAAANAQPQSENTSKKARIYNLIIVDESGSMSPLRDATISGINETIGAIHAAQEEFAATQEHFISVVLFDDGPRTPAVRTIIDCQPIGQIPKFTDYNPRGCTPLFDALGESLTRLRDRIEADPDATGVVTVLTDGLENASRRWNAGEVRRLINQLKELGWSFSYMGSAHDVKDVTDLLGFDNMVEFSHDRVGARNTWARESSSRRSFFGKIHLLYADIDRYTTDDDEIDYDEINARKRALAGEYYGNRVTPDFVETLAQNDIFVFGSNPDGQHNGGAAAKAMRDFGAVFGQGEGLQGHSYAIPTTAGINDFRRAVERFCDFAADHPGMRFLVTVVGCGNARYTPREVAPLFQKCVSLENVCLPASFWEVLGLKNHSGSL